MPLAAGSILGRYRIEGLIGRGGMGAVYRARDLQDTRPVALKVIAAELANDSQFRERFRREAGAAAALDHPHAVRVLDTGEEDGVLFLAMQLIDGEDLVTKLERERLLDTELAVEVVTQVASALDAAHATGLVHRDVKPANVLLEQRSRGAHAYLTDFGVARRLEERSRLTQTGMVVGTPGYLAPEALRGEGAGPAVDIYALGCVLFEALTGAPPFERENDVALILAHVEDPPPPLSARVPNIPAALDQIVQRALAKDPAERFASASAFGRAARNALRGESFTVRVPALTGRKTVDLAVPSPSPKRSTPVRKKITMVYATLALEIGLDPEVRLAALERFERLARPILERHGATIEALPTEGVVAVFGLPTLSEDDAARAVRAALALGYEVATEAGGSFVPTFSVITDVVLTGGETLPATSLGSLLQRAFRMQEAGAAGGVLVTGPTRDLARDAATYEAVDWTTAAEPLWRATGAAPDRAYGRAAQPRHLFGRESEQERLERVLSETIHRRSARLVTVLGAPGIGKSSLANGFASLIASRARVAAASCRPVGEADSREPVRELLGRLAGPDPSAFVRATVQGEDAEAIAERVEQLLAIREGPVPADELPWVARRFLSDVARRRPLVILIEDMHWAEPALLELVEHVAEWTRDAPLLLVCMARPELLDGRPDWGEGAEGVRIVLDPLSPEESLALVNGLQEAIELTDLVRDRIVQLAEGNPLFVEQMVAYVRDRPDRGDEITVPPNIHSLLAARIDRLSEEQRDAISHAAIIGREFSVAGLYELAAGALSRAPSVLHDLGRKDLIEPTASGDVFRFRHALIRAAAYNSVPMAVRARLHERHSHWLDSVGGSDEAVGYQLEQAVHMQEQLASPHAHVRKLAEQAGERLGRAGRAALERGEVDIATGLLGRASKLFGAGTFKTLALTPYLAHAVGMSGSIDAAYRLLVEAEPVAAKQEAVLAMHVAVARRHVGLLADPRFSIAEILRTCEGAIELFQAHDDVTGLVSAWSLKAWAHLNQSRCALAGEAAERGLAMVRSAGAPSFHEALLLEHVCMALREGPTPVPRAITRGTELLNSVQGTRRQVLSVAGDLAWLYAMAGAFDEAASLLEVCQAIVEELDIEFAHAAMALVAGEVELLAANPAAAERSLRPHWELLASGGERGDRAYLAAALARALEAQGRWAEAERMTEDTEKATFDEDRMVQADWRATRARLLARRGEHAPADALARDALTVAAETDALNLRGECALALARVLRHAGELREAARSAEAALAEYTAKENVVCMRRVERLLSQLESQELAEGRGRGDNQDVPGPAHG